MRESADADVIFVASLPSRSRALNVFASFAVGSPQTSPEMVFLGEFLRVFGKKTYPSPLCAEMFCTRLTRKPCAP